MEYLVSIKVNPVLYSYNKGLFTPPPPRKKIKITKWLLELSFFKLSEKYILKSRSHKKYGHLHSRRIFWEIFPIGHDLPWTSKYWRLQSCKAAIIFVRLKWFLKISCNTCNSIKQCNKWDYHVADMLNLCVWIKLCICVLKKFTI